jgi:tetratricopeptide (TPR) repeat protein
MDLRPQVNSQILIANAPYTFTEHPAAKGMPYGQSGRKATVYQIKAPDKSLSALKIFVEAFRDQRVASSVSKLQPFEILPGLQVCRRTVLNPEDHTQLLQTHNNLRYAVLMPWVYGETWQEFMLGGRPMTPDQCHLMAQSFAHILDTMESHQIAHCDLSGPNVLLPGLQPKSRRDPRGEGSIVALVDVEDLYAPGLDQPDILPAGSIGYGHSSVTQGVWQPEGDRFSAAVLLAEMLGWCSDDVIQIAYGEQFFDPAEMQQNSERYQILLNAIRKHWGGDIANLFSLAWQSATLSDCPTLAKWREVLGTPSNNPDETFANLTIEYTPTLQTQASDTAKPAATDSKTIRERLANSYIQQAEAYLQLGQIDKAIIELEEAYHNLPEVGGKVLADALAQSAKLKESKGDINGALSDYRRAMMVGPVSLYNQLESTVAELSTRAGTVKPTGILPPQQICPSCQKQIPLDAIICPLCRTNLKTPQPSPVRSLPPQIQPERQAKRKGILWIGGIGGTLLICLIITFGIFFLFFSGSGSQLQSGVSATATRTSEPVLPPPSVSTSPTPASEPAEKVALPTIALTLTITPEPTLPPQVFVDDFSNKKSGWIEQNNEDITIKYEWQNSYSIHVHQKNQMYKAFVPANFPKPLKDIVVSVMVNTPLSRKGELGILCRYQDDTNFYRIAIYPSGRQFRISKKYKGLYTYLTKFIRSEEFIETQANQITVSCIGETIKLEINGVLVSEVRDGDFMEGDVALFAATYEDPFDADNGFKALFKEFSMKIP